MHTLTRLIWVGLAAVFAILLSGCTTGTQTAPVAAAPVATQAYVLAGGDKVRVNVFGEAELSGEYEVDGAGVISMPLIDRVQAIGLTTSQLEQQITSKLANGYLVNPKVSAEVTNYRPFYILGEVNTPGEYQYTSGLTVVNAVAGAGGYTYRANKNSVFLRKAGSNSEVEVTLSPTTQIGPGDTLRIKERRF